MCSNLCDPRVIAHLELSFVICKVGTAPAAQGVMHVSELLLYTRILFSAPRPHATHRVPEMGALLPASQGCRQEAAWAGLSPPLSPHRSLGPEGGEPLPAPSLGPVPMFMTVYFRASRKEKLEP